MSTYLTTIMPSDQSDSLPKPVGRTPINIGVLAYMRARHRGHIYNLVLKEFKDSGINQAMLADRLNKKPEVISRWLGSPGNWTIDTVSDLLYAISGAEAAYTVNYPHDEPTHNYCAPSRVDYVVYPTPINQVAIGLPELVLQITAPHLSKVLARVG
jgi:hypothetical protein